MIPAGALALGGVVKPWGGGGGWKSRYCREEIGVDPTQWVQGSKIPHKCRQTQELAPRLQAGPCTSALFIPSVPATD